MLYSWQCFKCYKFINCLLCINRSADSNVNIYISSNEQRRRFADSSGHDSGRVKHRGTPGANLGVSGADLNTKWKLKCRKPLVTQTYRNVNFICFRSWRLLNGLQFCIYSASIILFTVHVLYRRNINFTTQFLNSSVKPLNLTPSSQVHYYLLSSFDFSY